MVLDSFMSQTMWHRQAFIRKIKKKKTFDFQLLGPDHIKLLFFQIGG